MTKKTLKIIGWCISGLVALIFIASGIFKLTGGNPEMVSGVGGEVNLLILGVLELIIVLFFLYPRTGVAGALLVIAYMAGAMAVHLVGNQSILIPTVIQIMIWAAVFLRFPELSTRLLKVKESE